jgi:CheY-like chemotaxis protein
MTGALILVVEDDLDTREAVVEVLRREGLAVVATDEGSKALDLLETCRPHLVLLDLDLSGLSGDGFCAAQRERPELAATPVVIMTGMNDPPVLGAALLRKPFGIDELLEVVARFTARDVAAAVPVP